jgi:hypothetical protein
LVDIPYEGKRWLRLERVAGTNLSSFKAMLGRLEAVDLVSLLDGEPDDILLCSVTFPNAAPTVINLCDAAQTVRQVRPYYNKGGSDSFFAGYLFTVLQDRYQGDYHLTDNLSLAGHRKLFYQKPRSQKLHSFNATREEVEEITRLVKTFLVSSPFRDSDFPHARKQ